MTCHLCWCNCWLQTFPMARQQRDAPGTAGCRSLVCSVTGLYIGTPGLHTGRWQSQPLLMLACCIGCLCRPLCRVPYRFTLGPGAHTCDPTYRCVGCGRKSRTAHFACALPITPWFPADPLCQTLLWSIGWYSFNASIGALVT